MSTDTGAAIEGLRRVPDNGKAEIVDGELLVMPPTGDLPGYAGAYRRLCQHRFIIQEKSEL